MSCLLVKNVQIFKFTLVNLNSKRNNNIDFLNKIMGKRRILFNDFSKKALFWNIPK